MLEHILAHKRTEIERLDLAALFSAAADAPKPRDFLAALSAPPLGEQGRARVRESVNLIAELKRASPSRGLLAPHLDLLQLARIYADNGAAAISVLTDEKFFLGSLATLRAIRDAPCAARLPLLRKDFILSPAQVYESRAAGADALLLIAAALPHDSGLADLHALTLDLGLTPLVEVHDLAEVERVLRLPGLKLIGINNRDLKTFTLSLGTTARLRPHIPAGICVVSESGIFTAAHVAQLAALDVDGILVGEALVTAPDIGAKVRELAGKNGG
ncbi:MAG: indole-3-glycerol phosphate synthase TrpC [Anaerolineales bacterium]